MKRNRGDIVHVPRGAELARPIERGDEHPVTVYLASLSPDSRPAMKSSLLAIARIVNPKANEMTLPWHAMRFSHSKAIRARIVEEFAPRTVNRMISAMRGVLKAAWNLGQLETDAYMHAIDVKRMATRSLPPAGRYIEEHEVEKLLGAAASQKEPLCFRDQAIVIFMYAGGLRRQEASAMDLADYSEKDGVFKVIRGKGGKYRDLAIATGYRSWLTPWVSFQKERKAEPMFVRWTPRGAPTMERLGRVGINLALTRVQNIAEVAEFSPHDLRRSFATLLLDNDVDVMIVQDLMGHANLETTKIYDRRGQKTRRAAVEKLPVVLSYEDYLKGRKS